MTLSEIKTAVDKGKPVYHGNHAYYVHKDNLGQYLIICSLNDYTIGLTWKDGKTLNGKEEEFFIGEP